MIVLALIFFASHYYVCEMSVELSRKICIVSNSALMSLCLFGALFLLTDSKCIRSRRVFALQMLLVSFAACGTVIRILAQSDVDAASTPMKLLSPGLLVYGNIYAFIMLLYPLELLYPGRIKFMNYFKLLLPALITGLFYYVYIRLTDYPMTDVDSWRSLFANLYRFDVWFRFTIILYPIWMFIVIMYQKKRYVSWCCKNYSTIGYINLGWLDYYLFGYFILLISYMITVSMHTPQNMLIHSLCFLIFFVYSFFNILRQEVPILPRHASVDGSAASADDVYPPCSPQSDYEETCASDDKYRFADKIPEYKVMLERWMQTEKPYMNKDFKLIDVMQVLPLNRSYLSRMFNEAYGETFFSYIMRYRIEESARMLETRHDLTITQIAQICGFSSASVFGRAFLKNMSMTPKEYRNR